MEQKPLPSFTDFLEALKTYHETVFNAQHYSDEQIATVFDELKDAFEAYEDDVMALTDHYVPLMVADDLDDYDGSFGAFSKGFDRDYDIEDADQDSEEEADEDVEDLDGEDRTAVFGRGTPMRDIGLAAYSVTAVGDDEDVPDGEGQVILQHIELSELGLNQETRVELEDRLRSYLADDDDYFAQGGDYDFTDLDSDEYDFNDDEDEDDDNLNDDFDDDDYDGDEDDDDLDDDEFEENEFDEDRMVFVASDDEYFDEDLDFADEDSEYEFEEEAKN